jgi:hypothetical protein
MPLKPCLDCGRPTPTTRCSSCEKPRQKRRNASRPHYKGDYSKRRAKLKELYPNGPCHLCHLWIEPEDWSADHLRPGDPDSILLPTHLSCNSSKGVGG